MPIREEEFRSAERGEMFKHIFGVSIVGLMVALTGCAPSDSEAGDLRDQVRAQIVETFRHHDSLCIGLAERVEKPAYIVGTDPYMYPYAECLKGTGATPRSSGYGYSSAPGKAWREVERYCFSLQDPSLERACLYEGRSQYFDRMNEYPDS